ncbi:TlpA disulfide reductase family protein [Rapidithrix thailandica]|uniref:TlpA disulfide reductase family protein n=1 Tax=Rapidithrix thailandica TaxID=413964 RepID=A0AAW9S4B4_9BACT
MVKFLCFIGCVGLICPIVLQAQTHTVPYKLSVKLGRVIGTIDPEQINVFPTRPVKEASEFKGIPHQYEQYVIREYPISTAQKESEMARRQEVSSKKFNRLVYEYGIDTLRLSKRPLAQALYFFMALTEEGKIVVIPDTNNNKDFSDEAYYVFTPSETRNQLNEIEAEVVSMSIDCFNGEYVSEKTFAVKLYPYISYWNDREEDMLNLYISQADYKKGTFLLGNEHYTVIIPNDILGNGNFRYTEIFMPEAFINQVSDTDSHYFHYPQQNVRFKNYVYNILGVFEGGDRVEFAYQYTEPDSAALGQYAAQLKVPVPGQQEFDLLAEKGRYVMLVFFGSWQGFSLGSVPELEPLYYKYAGQKLTLVSLGIEGSLEHNEVQRFAQRRYAHWVNSWMSMKDGKDYCDKFNIQSFPTTLLIDPEGKIVYKQSGMQSIQQAGEVLDKVLE